MLLQEFLANKKLVYGAGLVCAVLVVVLLWYLFGR